MSDRAAQLRAQADQIECEDLLTQAMAVAREDFLATATAENKAAYKTAAAELAASRQAARAGRDGLTITTDSTEG